MRGWGTESPIESSLRHGAVNGVVWGGWGVLGAGAWWWWGWGLGGRVGVAVPLLPACRPWGRTLTSHCSAIRSAHHGLWVRWLAAAHGCTKQQRLGNTGSRQQGGGVRQVALQAHEAADRVQLGLAALPAHAASTAQHCWRARRAARGHCWLANTACVVRNSQRLIGQQTGRQVDRAGKKHKGRPGPLGGSKHARRMGHSTH